MGWISKYFKMMFYFDYLDDCSESFDVDRTINSAFYLFILNCQLEIAIKE